MNVPKLKKNNNCQHNNLNDEGCCSEEKDYSSKNRDNAINMNTNANNTNTNGQENPNLIRAENSKCESSSNINLNNKVDY